MADDETDLPSASSEVVPLSSQSMSGSSHVIHDRLERRSSKSRLLKQDVIEVTEETELPALHEELDFHPRCPVSPAFPTAEQPAVLAESKPETEEEDRSPNSDASDQTVVPAELLTSLTATPHSSPKDNSPDDGVSTGGHRMISDSDKGSPTQAVNPKVKLVRSQAVYDDASSPPEILIRSAAVPSASPPWDVIGGGEKDCASPMPYSGGTATLSVSPTFQVRGLGRQRLGQDSSQGSTVSDNSPALSRDSSFETSYTDSTGTNLEEFIIKTLNKKQSDRTMLLHLENDMIAFIRDTSHERHRFPQMSSYHRMLVHRVAAFFGLDHNVDETGKAVVINRLDCTRIPDFRFRDHIHDDLPQEDPPKKFILKRQRDCTSLEETHGTDRVSVDDRISKSFEERQEEYHEARNRIFQRRELSQETSGMNLTVNRPVNLCASGQSSRDDVRWHPDLRPWSSTDSSGYSTDSSSRLKVYVTKASSFHSVTVLTRGDSHTSTGSSTSRFSKTDSLSSGLSNLGSPIVIPPTIPSSPPLEDQEYELGVSDVSVISPLQQKTLPAEDHSTSSPFLSFTDETGEPLAIWVASTIDQIPPGSIIINPQTGDPYINADGSVYRWYPPPDWTTSEGMLESEEMLADAAAAAASVVEPSCVGDVDDFLTSQLSTLSMVAEDGVVTSLDVASPDSGPSHLHPVQQMYLVTPGNPPPPSVIPMSSQRLPMQHVYPAPMPPPIHRSQPYFPPGVAPSSSVRYVCQFPVSGYPLAAAPNEGLESSQGHGGRGQPQYECMMPAYPSDVCQVVAFPQQMTVHSIETYQHCPSSDPGYAPQMVPCVYHLPQYGSERVENQPKPTQVPGHHHHHHHQQQQQQQQILYVPASSSSSSPACYSVDGAYALRNAPGGSQRPAPVAQYVCYSTYPPEGVCHSDNPAAGVPIVHPYPGSVPMGPGSSFVRPTRMGSYPASMVGQLAKSSSRQPGSSASQFRLRLGYPPPVIIRASSSSSSAVDPGSDHSGGREIVCPFPPPRQQQRQTSPRLTTVRQPQVVFTSALPASFPLGDSRNTAQNFPTVIQTVMQPRARVPNANVVRDSAEQSMQSQSSSPGVRDVSPREDMTKDQCQG